ncbi:hypothetical protein U1Q18_028776 [Sarracenia purpurea var. burkii]
MRGNSCSAFLLGCTVRVTSSIPKAADREPNSQDLLSSESNLVERYGVRYGVVGHRISTMKASPDVLLQRRHRLPNLDSTTICEIYPGRSSFFSSCTHSFSLH